MTVADAAQASGQATGFVLAALFLGGVVLAKLKRRR
jgi:hypothetical protein